MKKKIGIGIIAIIIVIGIVVAAIFGLNFSFEYSNHKEVDIYIGQEFENKEIQEIAKEVLGEQKIVIQKVELYEDMVAINTKDMTDEQLENLNTKINEKYGIENTVEDILVTEVPSVSIVDIVKPYIIPAIISFVLVMVYFIVYIAIYKHKGNDINMPKALAETVIGIVAIQLLYFAILAITRLPINQFTMPIAVVLFILTTIAKLCNNEKK